MFFHCTSLVRREPDSLLQLSEPRSIPKNAQRQFKQARKPCFNNFNLSTMDPVAGPVHTLYSGGRFESGTVGL